MSNAGTDKNFTGSIPKIYDTHLVPLIFKPYAIDLANRLIDKPISNVLEVAAGTGAVTRAMASLLANNISIIATDLNQPMLDIAAEMGTPRPVEWRQADVMQLPFDDAAFDAVVCQFGVMFFPDKVKAFSEVHRVLKPGGRFIFNVWDQIEENEFAETIHYALLNLFPKKPIDFMMRIPHSYYKHATIKQDLANAGFTTAPQIQIVSKRSRAEAARIPAIAFCQGTPLRNEIEARDASRLTEATGIVERTLAKRFGIGAVDGKIQAHVVTIEK